MPGHTFLYSPPVAKVRQLIDRDVLGDMYFVTSARMNLGKYQKDGVICDLAPHDLSILLHWFEEPIVQVAAHGRSVFQSGVPETAFLTVTFAGGATANIELSWLAPRKVRQMVVVGSRRMVQYDDTAGDEAIRIYDRGMEFETPENFGEYQLTYRSGRHRRPAPGAGRAAVAGAAGLRPLHPHGRHAALARLPRPRGRGGDGGGPGVADARRRPGGRGDRRRARRGLAAAPLNST